VVKHGRCHRSFIADRHDFQLYWTRILTPPEILTRESLFAQEPEDVVGAGDKRWFPCPLLDPD
jgi:hypothetical protein